MQNTILISYSRVSTKNVDQLQSLHNQLIILNSFFKKNCPNANNIIKLSDTRSVSNGLTDKLKKVILENKSRGNIIEIYLTAIDRLTRNIPDIDFIKKNIDVVTVIGRETISYNVKTDWKIILNFIASATEEIDKIKERIASRVSCKRKRSNINDLISNAQLRCNNILNLIVNGHEGVDAHIIESIGVFVFLSQNIKSDDDWEIISSMTRKYGNFIIADDYRGIDFSKAKHLSRNDVMIYVKKILDFQMYNFDENIVRAFVNAYINFSKKMNLTTQQIDEHNEHNEQDEQNEDYNNFNDGDNEIDELINAFMNLNVEKRVNLVKKFKSIENILNVSDLSGVSNASVAPNRENKSRKRHKKH